MTKNQGCNLFQSVKRAFVRKKPDGLRDVEQISDTDKSRKGTDARDGPQNTSHGAKVQASGRSENVLRSKAADVDPATLDLDAVTRTHKVNSQMMKDRIRVRQPSRKAPSSHLLNKMQQSNDAFLEGYQTAAEVHERPKATHRALPTAENPIKEQKDSTSKGPVAAPRTNISSGNGKADDQNRGAPLTKILEAAEMSAVVVDSKKSKDNKVRHDDLDSSKEKIEEKESKRNSKNLDKIEKVETKLLESQNAEINQKKVKDAGKSEVKRGKSPEKSADRAARGKSPEKSDDYAKMNRSKSPEKSGGRAARGKSPEKSENYAKMKRSKSAEKRDDEFIGVSSEEFTRNAQRSASEKKPQRKHPPASERKSKTAEDIPQPTSSSSPQGELHQQGRSSRKEASTKKKNENKEKEEKQMEKKRSSDEMERIVTSKSAQNVSPIDSDRSDRELKEQVDGVKEKKSWGGLFRRPSKGKGEENLVSRLPEPTAKVETRGDIKRSDSARMMRHSADKTKSPRHSANLEEMSQSAPNSLKKKKKETKPAKSKSKSKGDNVTEAAAVVVNSNSNERKKEKSKKKEESKKKDEVEVTKAPVQRVRSESAERERKKVKYDLPEDDVDKSGKNAKGENKKRNSDKMDDRHHYESAPSVYSKIEMSTPPDKGASSGEEIENKKKHSTKKVSYGGDGDTEKVDKAKKSAPDNGDIFIHPAVQKVVSSEPVYAVVDKKNKSKNFGQLSFDSSNVADKINSSDMKEEKSESALNKMTKRSISAVDDVKEKKERGGEELAQATEQSKNLITSKAVLEVDKGEQLLKPKKEIIHDDRDIYNEIEEEDVCKTLEALADNPENSEIKPDVSVKSAAGIFEENIEKSRLSEKKIDSVKYIEDSHNKEAVAVDKSVSEIKRSSAIVEDDSALAKSVEKKTEGNEAPWKDMAKRQSIRINWDDVGKKSNDNAATGGNELGQIFSKVVGKRGHDVNDVIENSGDKTATSRTNSLQKKPQPPAPSNPLLSRKLSPLGNAADIEAENNKTPSNVVAKNAILLNDRNRNSSGTGDKKEVNQSEGRNSGSFPFEAKDKTDVAAKFNRQPAAALKPIKAAGNRTSDDWITKAKESGKKWEEDGKNKAGDQNEASENVPKATASSSNPVNTSAPPTGSTGGGAAEAGAGEEAESVQDRIRRLQNRAGSTKGTTN